MAPALRQPSSGSHRCSWQHTALAGHAPLLCRTVRDAAACPALNEPSIRLPLCWVPAGSGQGFSPVERELVFDIDLTDYDDVRTCGKEGHICSKCWPLMAAAIKVRRLLAGGKASDHFDVILQHST